MKTIISLVSFVFFCVAAISQPTNNVRNKPNTIMLPNGWSLSPAGQSLPLGDLPLNMAISPSKKYLAVTNNGQSVNSIQLIDLKKEKIIDQVVLAKLWYGLAFADEENLYASGGNDNWIFHLQIENKKLSIVDTIKLGAPWPNKVSPAGIAIDKSKKRLYVVTKENNSLYSVNLITKKVVPPLALESAAYACTLSPDNKMLFITLWGGEKIACYDTGLQKITSTIVVGSHPNELLLSKKGNYLFVANANDNSVSVIDVKKKKVLETLNAALYPGAPAGSTTNGLALSADEKLLYIANADNNCLSVFDVAKPGFSKSLGFIPVGWYPTNIKLVRKKIYVSNGKGFSSQANPNGPNPVAKKQAVIYQKGDTTKNNKVEYIAGLFKGTLSIIPEPGAKQLSAYAQQVYSNTPYRKEIEMTTEGEKGNPIPNHPGNPSPIKYVFYIIKENRTYDQVLGDIKEGNGDPQLVLFGENITPNQHALARQFVLLDNFYVDGEVSADGHNWSTAAYATDYLEKTWPAIYGGKGGTATSEGRGQIAATKKGFIWDYCKRAGVSYRTYGEFADNYKANIPSLKNNFCPYFTGWDQKVRDTSRFYQWKREFDSLLQQNAVPQFNTLRFINDHTEGLKPGSPTPFAHVADNDYAVGLFIEHLSKTSIWRESVVFILEDDAQNGPDHVDAHRSTAYVAGGFVKRGFVDHTMYSTSSMLRTMELILGLPPMSQYDAAATPMWRCFSSTFNKTGFKSISPRIDLTEKNTSKTASARLSMQFDFSKEDNVPDLLFSEVIWKAVKGESSIMPAPKRSAFLKASTSVDEDDD